MAFDKVAKPQSARVEALTVTLQKVVPLVDGVEQAPQYRARYVIRTETADGIPAGTLEGDLDPHLTPVERSSLIAFMDGKFDKAELEALDIPRTLARRRATAKKAASAKKAATRKKA